MQNISNNYDLKLIYFISCHEFNVIVLQRHAHCKKNWWCVGLDNDIRHTDVFSHCLFLIEWIDVVCGPVGLTVGP